LIYLNNAATSFPKPAIVHESVARAVAAYPGEARRSSAMLAGVEDSLADCRNVLAGFFGAVGPDEVVLTASATAALNLVLRGLDYRRRRRVVTSAAEHNAVLRPLYALRKAGIIDLTIVACNNRGFIEPSTLAAALDSSVGLIAIQEASNVTGAVQNLAAASEIASRTGATLVIDGAQGCGMTGIDLGSLSVDAYVFAGHKNLFGLEGSGGVVLRRGLELEPLILGGTGLDSANPEQPAGRPDRYEAGTQNRAGAAAMAAGARYISSLGWPVVHERLQWFLDYTDETLKRLPGVRTPSTASCLPVFSFTIDGQTPVETAYCLENSFGIRVRQGLHCAPLIHHCIGSAPAGTVRASPSIFTAPDDWRMLFEALATITTSI